MRKSFRSISETMHIWAQQTQNEGRCGNVFFEGPSIYSYGHHFEIARFITRDIVLFTTRDYSVTTSGHKAGVRSAVTHKTVYTVPSFTDHVENVRYYMQEAESFPIKIKRARTNAGYYQEQMINTIQQARQYVETFAPEIPHSLIAGAKALFNKLERGQYSDIIEAQEQARKEQLERKRARLEASRREAAERLEQWKRGEDVYFQFFLFPTMLRVKGGEIQTSRGARVPIDAALAMYEDLKAGRPVHGVTVGHYTVTSFDGETLRVGCHEIPLTEMDRLYTIVSKMLNRAEA